MSGVLRPRNLESQMGYRVRPVDLENMNLQHSTEFLECEGKNSNELEMGPLGSHTAASFKEKTWFSRKFLKNVDAHL